MKKNFIIFILCLISGYAFAQNVEKRIVDEINSSKWGQGNVKVMQDEAVQGILAIHQVSTVDTTKMLGVIDPNAEFVRVKGFKIQAYSGNNQQRSKREANVRQSQIKDRYSELEATVTFHSPFWRLRVGNFLKKEDAEQVLKEMKKTFPSFGREMYVVPDVVKRPVEQ